jgi:hypothetical protein
MWPEGKSSSDQILRKLVLELAVAIGTADHIV